MNGNGPVDEQGRPVDGEGRPLSGAALVSRIKRGEMRREEEDSLIGRVAARLGTDEDGLKRIIADQRRRTEMSNAERAEFDALRREERPVTIRGQVSQADAKSFYGSHPDHDQRVIDAAKDPSMSMGQVAVIRQQVREEYIAQAADRRSREPLGLGVAMGRPVVSGYGLLLRSGRAARARRSAALDEGTRGHPAPARARPAGAVFGGSPRRAGSGQRASQSAAWFRSDAGI